MTEYERSQLIEANQRPIPAKLPAPARSEEEHSKLEGEYERHMVAAALKAAAKGVT